MILVGNKYCGYHSRGGSLFENKSCFALLDWGYQANVKKWAVANLGKYNLDPHQCWNHNRIIDQLTLHDFGIVERLGNGPPEEGII